MENLESIKEAEYIKAEKTVLVVIDLQIGTVNRKLSPLTGKEVVQNSSRLINAFAEKGAFVVLVKVSTEDGKDILKPNKDSKTKSKHLPQGWDSFVPELINVENAHHIIKSSDNIEETTSGYLNPGFNTTYTRNTTYEMYLEESNKIIKKLAKEILIDSIQNELENDNKEIDKKEELYNQKSKELDEYCNINHINRFLLNNISSDPEKIEQYKKIDQEKLMIKLTTNIKPF